MISGQFLTLFRVCVCPIRMRALDEMIERQKLMRITERSDRMYLQENDRTQNSRVDRSQEVSGKPGHQM